MTSDGNSILAREYDTWHTPVIGAFLFWNFAKAYEKQSRPTKGPQLLMFFLAAAILTDKRMDDYFIRRLSFRTFINALKDKKVSLSGTVAGLHRRVADRLDYTRRAIDIAVAGGFLKWNVKDGTLEVARTRFKDGTGTLISETTANAAKRAQSLGKWFASTDLIRIAAETGVNF